MLIKDAVQIMNKIAPAELKLEWDNPGLQLGRLNRKVTKVLFALDLTPEVVAEATERRVALIITHHPVFYRKMGRILDDEWQQELLLTCSENKIAVSAAHTTWDAAKGGVNDVLAKALGLKNIKYLDTGVKVGRMGTLPETTLEEFAQKVKNVLGLAAVTYIDGGRKVHKVAVCGGAGMDLLDIVMSQGCDTFVTADIKYHQAQTGAYQGLNLIDGTHQGTELPAMQDMLTKFAKLSGLECLLAKETRIMKVI
ncbi:MAG: Nif3-like dinuclear metal center hexameric protein [Acidaminococcaceae bacterium]|nr:Nif3-like dinuclear metal center hexameric protein [Acidaminococcaceae bacterium]